MSLPELLSKWSWTSQGDSIEDKVTKDIVAIDDVQHEQSARCEAGDFAFEQRSDFKYNCTKVESHL